MSEQPRRTNATMGLAARAALMTLFLAAAASSQPPAQPPVQPPVADPMKETPDEPGAIWAPAAPGNFQRANRPVDRPINFVVIHDIEGSAEGAVRWFQNPQSKVSAHYTMDATGKRFWQQVKERDIGYHAGNLDINQRSIGIEHEGYAYRPGFFNRDLYEGSARLVRSITQRNGIPRDREHIIAHAEVPHPTDPTKRGGRSAHTDPGPYWDWDYFMTLVRNDARLDGYSAPVVIRPGQKVLVSATFTNVGDDPWPLHDGKKNDAIQAQGPVYLGVRPEQPLPVYVSSPLYDRTTWLSPRYLAPSRTGAQAGPGQETTYAFSLLGPRELGPLTEQFRLVKVPVAPRMPVPFGSPLTLRMQVEPWRFIQEATPSVFAAEGWSLKQAGERPVYWRRFSGEEKAPERAYWTVPLPISGVWEVYTRTSGGPGRSPRAVYEVQTADGPRSVVVDQRRAAGWVPLGRFRFEGNKPQAMLALRQGAGIRGTVVAESLRLVGPFPEAPPAN